MYDKKKTIKGYMGGGYMKPMGYRTGGYIPGLSSLLYGAGLNRDIRTAQEEFEKQAEKVDKERKYRAIGGKIGKFLGKAAGYALAIPTGGVSVPVGEAVGATLGQAGGELAGGSLVDAGNIKDSSTGLYKDDFDYLRKVGKETESLKGLAGRSAVAGATTYGASKLGELTEGTEFDFGEAKLKDYFTDTARTTGIGGDSFAERVRSQALLDNPELAEEFSGAGLDLVDMPESDFVDLSAPSIADSQMAELNRLKELQLSPEGRAKYESLTSNPAMSYEESLRGSDRLGRLNTTIADINEAKVLRNQTSARSLNNLIKEFGDIPSAQKYRDRASSFADIIQRLESELEPATEEQRLLTSLQNLLQQYPEQSSLSGDSSNLDFIQAAQRRLRGYAEGGKIEEYGHGGLINVNSYARRIL
jgi:hypothetical protein